MRTPILKTAAVVLLSSVTLSCAGPRYWLPERESPATGTKKRYLFVYGKFCGPGHPDSGLTGEAHREYLLSSWPPIDEVDALCYAHDQCYASGADKTICDSVFQLAVNDNSIRVNQPGCWNLSNDIAAAFFLKFWERGPTRERTISSRLVGFLVGVPVGLFWVVVKAPFRPVSSHPAEGACVSDPPRNFTDLVDAFEKRFETSILNSSRSPLEIPVPAK
jgi:hypothetical protein